jgi:DNA-binding MarR family transcriptional regulator
MNEEMLQLLRLVAYSNKATEARLDAVLEPIDLSTTRLMTLRRIAQSEDALSLGQLATCLAYAKSNATQLVDRLEKDALVQRFCAPFDRRSTLLKLTEAGKERYDEALQLIQPLLDSLENLYTPEERAQLAALLSRMNQVI